MNSIRFILASLWHYRRIHFAVATGVAVATAVLAGALLVGDSVRGSLRDLTLQRLGRIDSVLVSGQMFRSRLADELAADAAFHEHFAVAEPAILTTGTLQADDGATVRRATAVSIVGCQPRFWTLGQGGPAQHPADGRMAITEPLAHELGVEEGDALLLRIPAAVAMPAESPLGDKIDTARARRFIVAAVLPPSGLARFSLAPSQHQPRSAFVPLEDLQSLVDKPGMANAILLATADHQAAAGEAAHQVLQEALRPRLEDYGLRVEPLSTPAAGLQITADQLVLPDAVVRAAERAFPESELQPIVTYLANTITVGDGNAQRKVPYSTITGVESSATLGPLLDDASEPIVLADDEIALNRWAAEDLQAQLGDLVTVRFYEPESTHGQLREHEPPARLKLRAIVDVDQEGVPTPAADPQLTPELPGVTDQQSINDWDLPFELVETIRPQDEDYWDLYRTTPKAFVSLETAKRLWASRWGTISLIRMPVAASDEPSAAAASAAERLAREIDPAALGMTFHPVKQLGLDAASGTTAFDALFLAFSFFLIASSMMLISLLFQLGVEQRARELGTLAAVGVGRRRLGGLLSCEGLVVAVVGASAGILLGILYAQLMITGLRTWWLAAIATPFLELYVTWRSLALGLLVGVAVSWLTIGWAIRRLVRQSAARLLTGSIAAELSAVRAHRRHTSAWASVRLGLLILIIGLIAAGLALQSEAQMGVFFGSGTAVLVLLLGEVRHRLRRATRTATTQRFSLWKLSALNSARNPGRSTLTIGLVAAASFLIVAVSAFRLDTGEEGTGGFDYIVNSDRPVHYDLNSPEGRLELGFSDQANRALEAWRVFSFRVAGGEDASCLNLYRPAQPRVLGVPNDFVARGSFAWSATDTRDPQLARTPGASTMCDLDREGGSNPWRMLCAGLGADERGQPIVPVVIDANTAAYSLHLSGVGSRLTIRDAYDAPVTLQVVGLLKNSVLQGSLLVSEAHFLQMFPDTGGYRFFLIERNSSPARDALGADSAPNVPALLETTLAEEGVDVVDARAQLAAFLAVQNTYLSTFQSLGALGLLLGTIGLAAVQLRSVLERRGELALMRAGGFSRRRLMRMVVWENAVLLLGGLGIGCVAATVALVPHWAPQGATIPWTTLVMLLAAVALAGLAAGWLATRSALQAPILPALRGD